MKQLAEDPVNHLSMMVELALESCSIGTATAARQNGQGMLILGQRMGLLFLHHLDPVLNSTQKLISLRQTLRFSCADHLLLCQQLNGFKGVALLQLRARTGIDQLQGLNEEFNFSNPPLPEFEVKLLVLAAIEAGVNLLLHHLDVLDHAEIKMTSENKGFKTLEQLITDRDRTGDRARLEHCRALPALAPGFIINLSTVKRHNQITAVPFRAQTGIDPKDKAIFGHLMESTGDHFRQLDKVAVQADLLVTPATTGFTMGR